MTGHGVIARCRPHRPVADHDRPVGRPGDVGRRGADRADDRRGAAAGDERRTGDPRQRRRGGRGGVGPVQQRGRVAGRHGVGGPDRGPGRAAGRHHRGHDEAAAAGRSGGSAADGDRRPGAADRTRRRCRRRSWRGARRPGRGGERGAPGPGPGRPAGPLSRQKPGKRPEQAGAGPGRPAAGRVVPARAGRRRAGEGAGGGGAGASAGAARPGDPAGAGRAAVGGAAQPGTARPAGPAPAGQPVPQDRRRGEHGCCRGRCGSWWRSPPPTPAAGRVLDYERELRNVLAAVRAARQDAADVRVVPFATLAAIRDELDRGPAHVLHISGHGSPGTLAPGKRRRLGPAGHRGGVRWTRRSRRDGCRR